MTYVVFQCDDDVVVCTKKKRKQVEKKYFGEDTPRNLDDYQIVECSDLAVFVAADTSMRLYLP